jgi:hypothetical protein
VLHQEGKQFKFLGREMDYSSGLAQGAMFQVQFQFARPENRGTCLPSASRISDLVRRPARENRNLARWHRASQGFSSRLPLSHVDLDLHPRVSEKRRSTLPSRSRH